MLSTGEQKHSVGIGAGAAKAAELVSALWVLVAVPRGDSALRIGLGRNDHAPIPAVPRACAQKLAGSPAASTVAAISKAGRCLLWTQAAYGLLGIPATLGGTLVHAAVPQLLPK